MRVLSFMLILITPLLFGCRQNTAGKQVAPVISAFPAAVDPAMVGKYPALSKSGGGYFYDDVLEYRVWIHSDNGDDEYLAFPTYEDALACSRERKGAEPPLVLVRQREWIDEPSPGRFERKSGERITEWQVDWLRENKRRPDSIETFLNAHRK